MKFSTPKAFEAFLAANPHLRVAPDRGQQGTKLERPAGNGALAEAKGETRNPAKFLVRIISYRRRLLDEDNLAEKYHVDSLRYASLLPDDSPLLVSIKPEQVKVKTEEEERTEIFLTAFASQ